MIHVVLHVANVINDKESECDSARPDNASALHSFFRNIRDQTDEKNVVAIPKIDDFRPRLILIAMGLHPSVLRVARPFVCALDRRHGKAHVVVRRGIDQVPKLLLRRP